MQRGAIEEGRARVLGVETDGFGRFDTRTALPRHFGATPRRYGQPPSTPTTSTLHQHLRDVPLSTTDVSTVHTILRAQGHRDREGLHRPPKSRIRSMLGQRASAAGERTRRRGVGPWPASAANPAVSVLPAASHTTKIGDREPGRKTFVSAHADLPVAGGASCRSAALRQPRPIPAHS